MINANGVKVTPLVMRQHRMVVEVEDRDGWGRHWSGEMPEREVRAYISQVQERGDFISDVDCSTGCWCVPEKW